MHYEAMPVIKLEIENMKSAILTHLGANNSDLGDAISAHVDMAIRNYDWQGNVKKLVHELIHSHIEDYFRLGEGRDLILSAVDEGFKSAIGACNKRIRAIKPNEQQ